MNEIKLIEDLYKDNIDLLKRKNADYSGQSENFFNGFEMSAMVAKIPVEKGIIIRMMDKMNRISGLLENEAEVKDESIVDTLADLVNYTAILYAYIKSKQQ